MSGNRDSQSGGDPGYLGWRAELLARLALSRLDNAVIVERGPGDGFFDFELRVGSKTIPVVVRAFSSFQKSRESQRNLNNFTWDIDWRLTTRITTAGSPAILMMFDVDSEEGRAARIDGVEAHLNSVILDARQVISKASLQDLVASILTGMSDEKQSSARSEGQPVPGIAKPENRSLSIFDSIHGLVEFSDLEAAILESAPLARLRFCLGHPTLNLVYPGARSSLFEHAVGSAAIIDQFLRGVARDMSQFMPQQYAAVRAGTLDQDARELALHAVDWVLQQYASACGGASA